MQVPDAVSRSTGHGMPSPPHPLYVPDPPACASSRATEGRHCSRHVMRLSGKYNVGLSLFLDDLRWVTHIAGTQLLVLEAYDGTENRFFFMLRLCRFV